MAPFRPSNPAIVTMALSAAAVLGYLTYRWTLDPPAPGSAPLVATAGGPALPDGLPAFSLADLEGERQPITGFAGKPMLVNFWATWCAPCLREIPLLKDYQSRHEDVRVVGIAVDDLEAVRTFAEEMEFNYPVLVGQSDAMNAAAAFGVDVFALPFTVFASAGGAVIGVHTGEIHAEHLDNFATVVADLQSGAIDLAIARRRMAGLM